MAKYEIPSQIVNRPSLFDVEPMRLPAEHAFYSLISLDDVNQ